MSKINFLILTNEINGTAHRLHEEAQYLGLASKFILYEELMHKSQNGVPDLNVNKNTVLFFETPFAPNNMNKQFCSLLRIIVDRYKFGHIINKKLLKSSFVTYEDKYYQAYLFDKWKVSYAPLLDPRKDFDFPIIAKERIASRGRGNYVLRDKQQWKQFRGEQDLSWFIFQEFYTLKNDYRVLVFQGKVLAVVRRRIEFCNQNKFSIRVDKEGSLPQSVLDDCIKISNKFNCELSGVDVGEKENGEFFFIEHNSRPQFSGSERVLDRNLAREIVKQLVDKVN